MRFKKDPVFSGPHNRSYRASIQFGDTIMVLMASFSKQ